ncbi:DNA/RNA non-specific endonuclease [Anoxybacteroides amylolyticum]|uniref:DNA/RNA non-specific endonuclease family protein n=1 Tax=Anoxybacteroides amylolyticum TaxID=294699 RepID=A0A160F564_9BACL|nr:DNA/RNA non-specific endonuclease [Anoxybacillus amylolyticus]ANB61629.1 DNA/RNA non-specific endonuclease family protein [Anoxybacillus amylolyticus]
MSFWSSLSKLGHMVEKKVEQTVKHVANDVKKVEKTIQQAVQQVEKKVEPVGKQVVKDTVHISQKAKEAFHQAEKKAEQAVKHVAHEVKQAEKAVQKIEKKVERAAKQAVKDTVHISEKAQKAFHEAEKKTEQAVKHVVHDVKKAVSEAVHPIGHKIRQEIKDTEKTIERGAHQLEKKAEHVTKQAVHGIINAGQNAERTVRQVGKNIEKSIHEFSKHPIDSTIEFVRGAGDAALADVTFNAVQQRFYDSKHPVAYEAGQMVGHAVWTIGGMKVTEISSVIGAGGAVVSLSGGGAFAGVPAMAAGAAGMTVGGVMMKTGITNFSKSASDLSQQLSRSEGVSEKASKGIENIKYGEQYTRINRKKALKPNIEYATKEGYRYTTDDRGRISSVEAKLELGKADRNSYAQKVVGREDRLPNDEGGHLIASIFKGSGDIDNLVPMNATLNRSEYKSLENTWKKALEEGKTVEVKIEPIYKGDSSRPAKFEVEYRIDGKKYEVTLTNYAGGK